MSLKANISYSVPEATARVAKAASPKGTLCLQIYDQLGAVFDDTDFADLYPREGQPAIAPFRLALVTLLQYMEKLSDRQAAEAVRQRLDWKYLLCLELEDPGFDATVLCEFRSRLVEGAAESRLLEKLLRLLVDQGLVKKGGRVRTDSTHVLACVRELNRLERVVETLRATLNVLATVDASWVQRSIPPQWVERYGPRAEAYRLPSKVAERTAYAEQVGADGNALLEALWSASSPAYLRQLPAVEQMRQVWIMNFVPVEPLGARWRGQDELPPQKRTINSPYEAEARYSKKRDTVWIGYKVHVTEQLPSRLPRLITQVETTSALCSDNEALASIQAGLKAVGLVPDRQLVDAGYTQAKNLLTSRQAYGIELVGPVAVDRPQGANAEGFEQTQFTVDWQAQRVICPEGKRSSVLRQTTRRCGEPTLSAQFDRVDCQPCLQRARCTSAASGRRSISLKPRPLYEILNEARARQQTDAFKEEYRQRSGIEGSLSQGVRAFGLRQARYRGYAKTRLQHLATAAAMNLVRLGAWWNDQRPYTPRKSPFINAMASAGA